MNFKSELIKNVLFKGVNVLLSFGVTVLMVRLLGAEGNGIYSLFITNSAIIALLVSFSFNSGLTYYSAKKEFSSSALLNSAFIVLLAQIIIILIAEKIFRNIFRISFYVESQSSEMAFWGSFYLLGILLNGYVSAIFTGNKWFDTLNIITVITNLIFILVFGYLLLRNQYNGNGHTLFILKTFILLTILQSIINLVILLKKIRFTFSSGILRSHQLKLVFMYAGVAFFANVFQFLAYRMDYWFINFYRTKDDLGLYALASKLSQVLWLLPMTIATVIIPFTVNASEELLVKVKAILRFQFNGYIFIGILMALVSPVLIPLIFGIDFKGSVYPFIILLPGVIIFTLTTILAAYFAGINRQDINLKISFFCFFTILAGDLLLVPTYGKEGAAVASCIGYALSGLASLYVFSKLSKSSFKDLIFLKKNDFRILKNLFSEKFKPHV